MSKQKKFILQENYHPKTDGYCLNNFLITKGFIIIKNK